MLRYVATTVATTSRSVRRAIESKGVRGCWSLLAFVLCGQLGAVAASVVVAWPATPVRVNLAFLAPIATLIPFGALMLVWRALRGHVRNTFVVSVVLVSVTIAAAPLIWPTSITVNATASTDWNGSSDLDDVLPCVLCSGVARCPPRPKDGPGLVRPLAHDRLHERSKLVQLSWHGLQCLACVLLLLKQCLLSQLVRLGESRCCTFALQTIENGITGPVDGHLNGITGHSRGHDIDDDLRGASKRIAAKRGDVVTRAPRTVH